MHSGPQSPDEQYGFLLLDDIRQLDATGRVSRSYDVAHNFNFEQVRAPKYQVIPGPQKMLGPNRSDQDFIVPGLGKFKAMVSTTPLGPSLSRIDVNWAYAGAQIPGVKLTLIEDLPVTQGECQYYLFPGILYNGNHIGQVAHYLGEDFPEDAITTPGGVSVETKDRVYGAWISPQKGADDPKASVRLEQSGSLNRYRIVYQLPDSVQFGHIMDTDIDQRFTVEDGFAIRKSFYFYAAEKETYAPVSNVNQGYGTVGACGVGHALFAVANKSPEFADGRLCSSIARAAGSICAHRGCTNWSTHVPDMVRRPLDPSRRF
jgi:hypothetical protein